MEVTLVAIIPGLLTGIAICIPLCVQLVRALQKLFKEKRWSQLIQLVIELMEAAEEKLADGADRKAWVLAMVKASAEKLGCQYDETVIGDMIDSLATMAKTVNSGKTRRVSE